MISKPYVEIYCDRTSNIPNCNNVLRIDLTTLAGGCYDERNVKDDIEDAGWKYISEDTQICENCKEHENENRNT